MRRRWKKDWQLKGPQHTQARAFVYEIWPKLNTAAELKERMPEAFKAFKACQEANDTLTPLKLLKANVAHVAKLNAQLEGLQKVVNEDNKKAAETIDEVAKDLKKLTEEVTAYLKTARATASR